MQPYEGSGLMGFVWYVITRGLSYDPSTVVLKPIWPLAALVGLYFCSKIIFDETNSRKVTAVSMAYAPIATALITVRPMVLFLPLFLGFVDSYRKNDRARAAFLSAASAFIRPDGVFLWALNAYTAFRERRDMKVVTASLVLVLGSFAMSYLIFGDPLHHLSINLGGESTFLDFGRFIEVVKIQPFIALTTLAVLPIIIYLALKGPLRAYYLFLLLFGILNPTMMLEINRWGGVTAIPLFAIENKNTIQRYFRYIFPVEIVHTVIWTFLRLRFVVTQMLLGVPLD
jgi:hypothetical protein